MSGDDVNPQTPQWPPAYVEFMRLFNHGKYWESHEVLETPWRTNRSEFYKGLIIFASAFVHAQRGNPAGIRKQMLKVKHYLEPYRPHYMGIDVAAVLERADECLEMVAYKPDLAGRELTQQTPFMQLQLHPEQVRGDEPELFRNGEE